MTFILSAYRKLGKDGEAVHLFPLLDQIRSESELAEPFGFTKGVPSENWLVLTHRKLVDDWDALLAMLPWRVRKPSRVLDLHSDRSSLIARAKKLKAY